MDHIASRARRTRLRTLGTVVVTLLVIGCTTGSGSATAPAAPTTGAGASPGGSLTVMAPGPLKGFLEQAKAEFEAANAGVTIQLDLAHVPALLAQLDGGIVGDVLVTPDAGSVALAASKGFVAGEATTIALIPMALVVPAGNPGSITSIDALGDEGLTVAVCAAELPCGKLADQLADAAGITLAPDTREVGGSPAIVTKASVGEIDVGLILATDAAAGGSKVATISIPADQNVLSQVSAAVLDVGANQITAQAFVAFLASPRGTELAQAAGMSAP